MLSKSTPTRVLMVSKAVVVGAYQRKLEEIAAHETIDLSVVTPPYWRDDRGRLALEREHTTGYEFLVEPMRFNGNFHLHHYPGLKRRIDAVQPHIVHIDEEPYNLATFLALRAARKAGAKTLFFSWQNIRRRYPPPFSWMEHYVLHHANAAIVGNEEARDIWRAKGYKGPMTIIPQFGVDPAIFSPSASGASEDHFTIGYAGRLVPEKGLETLIRAARLLSGRWLIRLLGDGPQRDKLHELASLLNIGGAVKFEEPIQSGEMPDWYRQLDVFVLPSRTRRNWKEQFGRVLIEAMACQVPVVGSDSGAIPWVLGPAGLTFPEGDEEALASQLRTLMVNSELRNGLAKTGRQRVLKHFTQKQIAAKTVVVYRSLLE